MEDSGNISTTFKGNTPATTTTEAPKANKQDATGTQAGVIEPPLTIYEQENKKPFCAEYFQLGDHWGEFEEITPIENYLKGEVSEGRMENSLAAAKAKLKSIEKMVNLDPSERQVVKLGKILAYVKFLNETKNIERNSSKYGRAN